MEEATKENIEKITDNTEIIKQTGVKLSSQERHKRIWEAFFYSQQRIDILLIAISGGGIYVCFETLKYYTEHNLGVHYLIKISAILLLLAIIFNFISQWCAAKVHYNDYHISTIDFTCEENGTNRNDHLKEIQDHECKIFLYSKVDSFFSTSSIFLMVFGLFGLIIYFVITF